VNQWSWSLGGSEMMTEWEAKQILSQVEFVIIVIC
jgi:hypothetical protein